MKPSRSPQVSSEGGAVNPPRFASSALLEGLSPGLGLAHRVEQDVQRELLAHPRLRFSSLVVRRIDDGVCLQGVVESDENAPDICSIAQRVAGVRQVLNRLVVAPGR